MAVSDVIPIRLVRALDEQVPVRDAAHHLWISVFHCWVGIMGDKTAVIRCRALDMLLDFS